MPVLPASASDYTRFIAANANTVQPGKKKQRTFAHVPTAPAAVPASKLNPASVLALPTWHGIPAGRIFMK